MISSCCKSEIKTDYHFNNELCPSCGEHCEIEDIDDDIENQSWLDAINDILKPKEKSYE